MPKQHSDPVYRFYKAFASCTIQHFIHPLNQVALCGFGEEIQIQNKFHNPV